MHKGRGGVAYEDLVVGDGAVAARGQQAGQGA